MKQHVKEGIVREKLARVLFEQHVPMNLNEDGRLTWWLRNKDSHLHDVDAILNAMLEPSKTALSDGATAIEDAEDGSMGSDGYEPYWDFNLAAQACWQAMLRAAKEE